MKQKTTPTLIAPCGMNCALCLAFQRKKNKCHGCRQDFAYKPYHCKKCSIVFCKKSTAVDKKFCYECAKFPCRRIKDLDKRYKKKYHMSMIDNLIFIKEKGIKKFLKIENEKWRCKHCSHLISVHLDFCMNCREKIIFDN